MFAENYAEFEDKKDDKGASDNNAKEETPLRMLWKKNHKVYKAKRVYESHDGGPYNKDE